MTVPTKTLTQFVSDMVTAWAGAVGVTPVLTTGDGLYALFEAVSAELDFLQAQVQICVLLSRAQTSTGSDLDSWMAQFNFFRLPAAFAEGQVTFGKLTPAVVPIYIPAATLTGGVYSGGALIQTSSGTIQYQVIPDTTEPTYNASLNAYVLGPGQTSLTATVQAVVAGSAYNVTVGQLSQIASALAGIDTVTNGANISNGANAESDQAFLNRFPLYLASLTQGTKEAITYAASSVQQGLFVDPLENTLPNGAPLDGVFTIVVDDGSGSPPSGLLQSVYNAVYNARAFTVQPYVIGPQTVVTTITLAVRVANGYLSTMVTAAVQEAVIAQVNSTEFSGTLFVSALEEAALAVAGCVAVEPGTTINGLNEDLVLTGIQVPRATSSSVTVGTY